MDAHDAVIDPSRTSQTAAASSRRARGIALALGAAVLAAATGCASVQPQPPSPKEPGIYRIAPPDELRVSVLPDPPIDRSVTVRPDGKISIDLVGDVQAAGRTTEDVAAEIQERIAKYKRDPVVTVTLVRSVSTAVTVLGEVSGPNNFPLDKDTRVVEAIGRVGGTTQFAARSRVRVVRSDVEGAVQVIPVDLDRIHSGDLTTNVLLKAGDIVYVPPTIPAQIGYWIAGITYPITQILGFGGNVAVKVFSGGAL